MDIIRDSETLINTIVSEHGFHPKIIVGIEKGGVLPFFIMVKELNRLAKDRPHYLYPQRYLMDIRRGLSKHIHRALSRFPRLTSFMGPILRPLVRLYYDVARPKIIKTFKSSIPPNQKVLVVDDDAATGETLRVAIEHLIEKGAKRENIKTAVLQLHPRATTIADSRPDFYIKTNNLTFPWSNANQLRLLGEARSCFEEHCINHTRLLVRKGYFKHLLELGIDNPEEWLVKYRDNVKKCDGYGEILKVFFLSVPCSGLLPPKLEALMGIGTLNLAVKRFVRSVHDPLERLLPDRYFSSWASAKNALIMAELLRLHEYDDIPAYPDWLSYEQPLRSQLKTPMPIAAVSVPDRHCTNAVYLITDYLPNVSTLSRALRKLDEQGDYSGKKCVSGLAGRAVGELHALGFFHGDLTVFNLWVELGKEIRIWIGDLDRSRKYYELPKEKRLYDLEKLNAVAKDKKWLGDSERRAFVEGYETANIIADRTEFLHEVKRRSEKRVEWWAKRKERLHKVRTRQ